MNYPAWIMNESNQMEVGNLPKTLKLTFSKTDRPCEWLWANPIIGQVAGKTAGRTARATSMVACSTNPMQPTMNTPLFFPHLWLWMGTWLGFWLLTPKNTIRGTNTQGRHNQSSNSKPPATKHVPRIAWDNGHPLFALQQPRDIATGPS